MKGLIIGLGVVLSLVLGLSYSVEKPKPLWWKYVVILLMTLTVLLTFVPYIGGNFSTFIYLSQNIDNYSGPIYFKVVPNSTKTTSENSEYELSIFHPNFPERVAKLRINGKSLPSEFSQANSIIARVKYNNNGKYFTYLETISVNPLFVLPLVPQLEEQIRIMNFHVPCAWVSVVAYLFAMFFGIKYLKTRNLNDDLKASASVYLGTLFAMLATVTGMIWAKFNWGSFWNWDPRQTSIFVLLLIYFAYFVLRQSIENVEIKARLSSVYSIIGFLTVPFLVFVLPRLLEGNHPGSANDTTAGPIISSKENTISLLQTFGFSLGFASFTLLYFWILNLIIRYKYLLNKLGKANV
jgi:heme exporter protein C